MNLFSTIASLRGGKTEVGDATAKANRLTWGVGLLAITYFGACTFWIGYAAGEAAGLDWWIAPFARIALPLYLAAYWVVAAALVARLRLQGLASAVAIACALSATEWLRGHSLFQGFPWMPFGMMLSLSDSLLQSAALFGVYGLTFIAFLAAAMGVAAITRVPRSIGGLASTLIGLALLWAWGTMRLAVATADASSGTKVRIVQPLNTLEERRKLDRRGHIFESIVALTKTPGGSSAALIVWPESAIPFRLLDSPRSLGVLTSLLPTGAHFVVGGMRREADPAAPAQHKIFNSITNYRFVRRVAAAQTALG